MPEILLEDLMRIVDMKLTEFNKSGFKKSYGRQQYKAPNCVKVL